MEELMKIKTSWEFVEAFYSNYGSSDLIAYAGDLDKILSGEMVEGDCSSETFKHCGSDFTIVHSEYDRVHVEIYKDAIEGFIDYLKKM